ncbi:MAG: 5'/3'-nucleotidase SurE [Candidatus Woesearchaeota archaeon]
MVDILLTNDDGYKSIGFLPLLKKLSEEFSVTVVAPSEGKSWMGKSITTKKHIELKKADIGGFEIYCIDGTPADCVQIGMYDVINGRPKLVVSGINIGANPGHGRILSSGTVGAAMEASIDGVKAISSSLYIPENARGKIDFYDAKNYHIFENAAEITLKVVKIVVEKKLQPDIDLISLNIPFDAKADSDFEVTKPFRAPYGRLFHRKDGKLLHADPPMEFKDLEKGTDLKALSEGKIAITPVSLELFSKDSAKSFESIIRKEW